MVVPTIYLGDMLEQTKKIEDESIQLVITDPPYGTDFKNDIYDDSYDFVISQIPLWLNSIERVLAPNSHLYFFVPTKLLGLWLNEIDKVFTVKNIIATQCYVNNRFQMKNNFCFDAQYIVFAHKGEGREFNNVDWIPTSKTWLNDTRNTNKKPYTYMYPNYISNKLIRANPKANKTSKMLHPNEKNSELIKYFIMMSSNIEDTVLDPFAGSGSTGIGSMESGRNCILIEKNKDLCIKLSKRFRELEKKERIEKNEKKGLW